MPSAVLALAADSFTGTNGSALSSTWNTGGVVAPSTATIQSNAAALTSSGGTGYDGGANIRTVATAADVDTVVTITPGNTDEQYGVLAVRADGTWNGSHPSTCYGLDINFNFGTYIPFKAVATVETNFATVSGLTVSTAKRARIQVFGTTFRMRVWEASGAEPSTWDQTNTDSSVTAAGSVALTANNGTTGVNETVSFDDFVMQIVLPLNTPRMFQGVHRAASY